MCALNQNQQKSTDNNVLISSNLKCNIPLNCKWKFIKLITDGIDNTIYAINDILILSDNGKAFLKSDGVNFDGRWSINNFSQNIKLFFLAKYSNEQSGMGYNADYELKITAKIQKSTHNTLNIKGISYAFVVERHFGVLPTLPTTTEIIYPFEWQLIKVR